MFGGVLEEPPSALGLTDVSMEIYVGCSLELPRRPGVTGSKSATFGGKCQIEMALAGHTPLKQILYAALARSWGQLQSL